MQKRFVEMLSRLDECGINFNPPIDKKYIDMTRYTAESNKITNTKCNNLKIEHLVRCPFNRIIFIIIISS